MTFYKISEEILTAIIQNIGAQPLAQVMDLYSKIQNGVEEIKEVGKKGGKVDGKEK